jgi:hypothetical protein
MSISASNFTAGNGGLSLGQLAKIIREPQMEAVVDRLIDFSSGKDEELRDISGLGSPSIALYFCTEPDRAFAYSSENHYC